MNLLKLANRYFLLSIAGIREDLIKKYPELEEDIITLSEQDPSKRNKYLSWAVKQLIQDDQASTDALVYIIKSFNDNYGKLPEKDINKYKYWELKEILKELQLVKSKRMIVNDIKTTGADKIHEDDQCVVLHIKTQASACFYGNGTKWCITMKKEDYYKQYVDKNIAFFYILRKDLDFKTPIYKVAVCAYRDIHNKVNGLEFYNSYDDIVEEPEALAGLKNGPDIISKIMAKAPSTQKAFKSKLLSGEINIKHVEKLIADDDFDNLRDTAMLSKDPEILQLLSKSKNVNIREFVSQNINCPLNCLEKLSDPKTERDSYVREYAKRTIDKLIGK